jgi:ribosomal 50S subunit-recycling heat shock protein
VKSRFRFYDQPMRLDLYLKLSRLIPRRTLAQQFCDKGLIAVNGATAKPSKEVKACDTIQIRRRNALTTIRITAVPDKKQLSKAEAGTIFEVVSTETVGSPDPLA